MSIKQKSLVALLGFGLFALLNSSVFATEPNLATNSEGAHSWSKDQKDCHEDHFAKHMSILHDALKLSANQESAWTVFSNKMKPVGIDQVAHQDWHNMSTPDRFDHMLEMMKAHEKTMAEHAATVRTFYDTLSADQKKIFDEHFQEHHRHPYFHEHSHGGEDGQPHGDM